MSAAKLVRPSVEYKESFLKALDEFHKEERLMYLDKTQLSASFEDFVETLCAERGRPHQPYQDWVEPVPETVLWMVKDSEYLGTVDIRHRLNWHLEKWGGHIHFFIRPTMRGKGFGKKLLLKAIPFANYLGIERALLTIAPEHEIAKRVIESCGGEFEDQTTPTEQFPARARYWLDCT
jgi:predicted acetyltransferase